MTCNASAAASLSASCLAYYAATGHLCSRTRRNNNNNNADDDDGPDARLRVCRDVCALVARACAHTTPSPSSTTEQRQLLSLYEDALLRGVQDAWSRVRAVAVDGVVTLATTIVACHGDNDQEDTMTNDIVVAATHERLVCKALMHWSCARSWYAKEGLLRLLCALQKAATATTTTTTSVTATSRVRAANMARRVLHDVALVALADAQLPVREHAAELVALLARAHAPLARYTVTRLLDTLAAAAAAAVDATRLQSSCNNDDSSGGCAATCTSYALEGHLLALRQIVRECCSNDDSRNGCGCSLDDTTALDVYVRVLQPLAAHAASSVRQCVAELLCRIALARRVLRARVLADVVQQLTPSRQQQQHASLSLSPCWQRVETLLMALHQHLHNDLAGTSASPRGVCVRELLCGLTVTPLSPQQRQQQQRGIVSTDGYDRNDNDDERAMRRAYTALCVAATSDTFELTRIGVQVLPLFVQWCVRFARDVAVPCCVFAYAYDDNDTTRHGNVAALRPSTSLSLLQRTVVWPQLWWCVAIRHATDAAARADVAAAVRAWLRVHDNKSDNNNNSDVNTPGGSSRVAYDVSEAPSLLVLTTYMHAYCVDDDDTDSACAQRHALSLPLLLLHAEAWQYVLQRCPQWLHICLDWVAVTCAHACRRRRARVWLCALLRDVLPQWAHALTSAPPHQQCILLTSCTTALSYALYAQQAQQPPQQQPWRAHTLFGFVYHDDVYGAPALLDGGEAVVRGEAWLRAHFAAADNTPTLSTIMACNNDNNNNDDDVENDYDNDDDDDATATWRAALASALDVAFVALVRDVLGGVYTSRTSEATVLREARTLMLTGVQQQQQQQQQSCAWACAVLRAVIDRLDRVVPQWRCNNGGSSSSSRRNNSDTNTQASAVAVTACDDWDDDDDDDDAAPTLGVTAAHECAQARALVSAVLAHAPDAVAQLRDSAYATALTRL